MSTHLAGPLFVGGVQVGILSNDLVRGQLPGGQAWYVCNRSGVKNGMGKTPDAPFKTLAQALASLRNRAHFGDCIYILPGHSQDVSDADWAAATGSAAGFSIVGIGSGSSKPKFTWTAATATWLLDTAGVELANLQLFLAGPHAAGSALTVAAPITVSGDNCRIVGCDIWWGFDADQIVNQGIIVTGKEFEFIGNRAIAETAAAPTATFMTLTAADRAKIIGNYIRGATSGTTVGVVRGLTTASLDLLVEGNTMMNMLASSAIAFSPLAASTGSFAKNHFFVNAGILPITASIGAWFENWCCDTAGQTGAKVGTASS